MQGVATLPVGATVDASKGVVAIHAAANGFQPGSPRARRQSATIRAGIFAIRQARARTKRATIPTDLIMAHPADAKVACTASRPRKSVVRSLTIVAKGLFRTVGGASTATARNATFTTTDRCDGTLTRVRKGRVTLKLKRRGPIVRVSAGRTYLAKARLFSAKLPASVPHMEFSRELRDDVLAGHLTLSVRLWKRPQVKEGGRYRVGSGLIEIDAIELVPFSAITEADVRRAGEPDRETLRDRAAHAGPIDEDTLVYRIELHVVSRAD